MNILGKKGEDSAASFLKKRGYRIIEKNYRTPFGELDIIAADGDTVVFVEVKTRSGSSFGRPFEAVNRTKMDKMIKSALCYLKKGKKERRARFDVLSIRMENGVETIEHIPDAFEA